MELSLMQALLLAAYYWFATWYMFYSIMNIFIGPLFTGLICGLVMYPRP